VQTHANKVGEYQTYAPDHVGGYSKYFPHEKKVTESPNHKELYPVRINNHGSRGDDFEAARAPGTVRILTLGASSTFGYYDRDDETFPYYLKRTAQLMTKVDELRVECLERRGRQEPQESARFRRQRWQRRTRKRRAALLAQSIPCEPFSDR